MQNQENSKDSPWTILKLLEWTSSFFKNHGIEYPRGTAEILLAHLLDLTRIDLYLKYDQPLSRNELSAFKALIKRRMEREPVAYITGRKEFWSMDFIVNGRVLIPRPETECLVETVLDLLPVSGDPPRAVLELGAGSGAVSLAVASERPHHRYFMSDISTEALRVASENAKRHKLERRIRFLAGDWFSPFGLRNAAFDVIVSNPPYIPTRALSLLQEEISRYEPILALDGGEDGLFPIRSILEGGASFLKKGGSLVLEIGDGQENEIRGIIDRFHCYAHVTFKEDYSGKSRVVQMEKA
jgi:release factor glutamine methyltransferase